ncbi:hypothetical protein [Cryobacterium sp. PH29-G1]|uniref:hypothetical protein n=1 Tax=Cryobacterium sp. PH29-G1 TaxID=3046211 RepID=UPI0024B892F9|nr:hypothetical protein [Cryobacterium sp. PH29-G1]MDJ0349639.1 hypothetical protein [Cryobacterium sp. PH29-G1]
MTVDVTDLTLQGTVALAAPLLFYVIVRVRPHDRWMRRLRRDLAIESELPESELKTEYEISIRYQLAKLTKYRSIMRGYTRLFVGIAVTLSGFWLLLNLWFVIQIVFTDLNRTGLMDSMPSGFWFGYWAGAFLTVLYLLAQSAGLLFGMVFRARRAVRALRRLPPPVRKQR